MDQMTTQVRKMRVNVFQLTRVVDGPFKSNLLLLVHCPPTVSLWIPAGYAQLYLQRGIHFTTCLDIPTAGINPHGKINRSRVRSGMFHARPYIFCIQGDPPMPKRGSCMESPVQPGDVQHVTEPVMGSMSEMQQSTEHERRPSTFYPGVAMGAVCKWERQGK